MKPEKQYAICKKKMIFCSIVFYVPFLPHYSLDHSASALTKCWNYRCVHHSPAMTQVSCHDRYIRRLWSVIQMWEENYLNDILRYYH